MVLKDSMIELFFSHYNSACGEGVGMFSKIILSYSTTRFDSAEGSPSRKF